MNTFIGNETQQPPGISQFVKIQTPIQNADQAFKLLRSEDKVLICYYKMGVPSYNQYFIVNDKAGFDELLGAYKRGCAIDIEWYIATKPVVSYNDGVEIILVEDGKDAGGSAEPDAKTGSASVKR